MRFLIINISRHETVGNGVAIIVVNGEQCFAVKQGRNGFWGFRLRGKLNRDQLNRIDTELDAALKKFDTKRRK